jgi:hypothetical protein
MARSTMPNGLQMAKTGDRKEEIRCQGSTTRLAASTSVSLGLSQADNVPAAPQPVPSQAPPVHPLRSVHSAHARHASCPAVPSSPAESTAHASTAACGAAVAHTVFAKAFTEHGIHDGYVEEMHRPDSPTASTPTSQGLSARTHLA